MSSLNRIGLRTCLLVLGVTAVACNTGDVVDANLSGGSGGADSGSGSGGPGGTADDADTGVATEGVDGSTGNSGGGDQGDTDGPMGVDGEECQQAQAGLCETPGQMMHCYSGAEGTCDVGECQGGVQTCVGIDLDLGEWSECEGEVTPSMEVCDGVDNDCDGEIDEGLGQSSCGQGECNHTVDDCVDGSEQSCDPNEGSTAEVCDGLDNDCDGDIDEDFAGMDAVCGVGACEHLVAACVDGMEPSCDPFEGAAAESCDGLDNDCDGAIDEDFAGMLTCGIGVCDHSVPECLGGVPQICDPFDGQGPEICNGLDDDCDGPVDEGFGTVSCGLGVCQHLVEQCLDGFAQPCDPFLGAGPEICDNGLDDDCDGMVDEGCVCGNGSINGSEQCDGADLGGATCVGLGHDGGTLDCNGDCTYDESGCYDCGDGSANPGEQCDGADLNGATCVSQGHDGGSLGCNPNCTYNESGCWDCGDGSADPGEDCDGADLGGATCNSLGYDSGTLGCNPNCSYDTSGCGTCGDGAVDPTEECDGANLGGATCATVGFDGGTLGCNPDCTLDTSGCYVCAMMPIGGFTDVPGPMALPPGGGGMGGGGGGGGCGAEPVIDQLTCSSTYNGQVLDGPSGIDGPYTCGVPYGNLNQFENEDVYSFECQADGDVELLLSGMDCDLDIYVLDATCDPDTGCLNGSTVANTASDSVIFGCVAGQTYYIVIEGYGWAGLGLPPGICNPGEGNYTLEFTVGDITGGCLEDCDDGIDNDADGDIDCADIDCAMDPVCTDPCLMP